MYNKKLVACIRVNGKVLREYKDTVYLPFNSEYQIRLKNLNTVKALVNVYIDGDNVVPGGLVLNAGQELDLERAIRNNNLSEGNKFKFIERTGNIEKNRGIKLEDGLIRVEYQFEKIYKRQDGFIKHEWWNNDPYVTYTGKIGSSQIYGSAATNDPVISASLRNATLNSITAGMAEGATLSASSTTIQSFNATPENETGITVPGSKSEQKFVTAGWFATEPEKHNIILKLLGETAENEAIRNPITVKHKPKCVTCGKQNKAAAKFCNECGTSLEIFA